MKEQVQKAIDKIRPALQADGGDVELVDVSADGGCVNCPARRVSGCPMSQMTFKNGHRKGHQTAGAFRKEVAFCRSVPG